ncbi:MAG: UDP-N-acetylmuramate dehydrogenase [Candidatus Paceibacterota bacterium]|jgi:UDP-N-acetylmuramate dehydrogenase
MNLQEHIPLASLTTFHIGGPARFFREVHSEEEIKEAIKYAQEHNLALYPLGAGSNILIPDTGIDGAVLKMVSNNISFENESDKTLLIADAGALWENIVDAASNRELFGIENLAGIPGTMGGAVVQNIGAYGAEFSEVFQYADTINSVTGESVRIHFTDAEFAYRTSFFKKHREYIIVRAALRLSKKTSSNITYKDLARLHAAGESLNTPSEIVKVIRSIRVKKFPDITKEGTAGSFFKNPIVSRAIADDLLVRFPGLPMFLQENNMMKLSLAWILDNVLSLKGFSRGFVRLYEAQPLVIVASRGATAVEVDAFANEISERVFTATGITIEREVEMISSK